LKLEAKLNFVHRNHQTVVTLLVWCYIQNKLAVWQPHCYLDRPIKKTPRRISLLYIANALCIADKNHSCGEMEMQKYCTEDA